MRAWLALVPMSTLGITLMSGSVASARAANELGYRVDEVFSTAQRYVRVDRNCKITDKDGDAAYVVFECPLDEKRVSRGALEIFRTEARGKEGVRVQVTLSDESHGTELRFLELLERKLRDERGTPHDAKKPGQPAPAPLAPDAGATKLPF